MNDDPGVFFMRRCNIHARRYLRPSLSIRVLEYWHIANAHRSRRHGLLAIRLEKYCQAPGPGCPGLNLSAAYWSLQQKVGAVRMPCPGGGRACVLAM